MSKGPAAFRTISEVADELDLPQHVLRFWETRFTQIRPMKRGGGRRYYRPDDIELLRGIRHLLYGEGYTIRGVQRILREQGPRFVIGAGRGDMSGLVGPDAADDEPDGADEGSDMEVALSAGAAEMAEPEEEEADGPRHVEPTFNPREFRPAPRAPEYATLATPQVRTSAASVRPAAAPPSGMSRADIDQLQSTLADLLELKRRLDTARD